MNVIKYENLNIQKLKYTDIFKKKKIKTRKKKKKKINMYKKQYMMIDLYWFQWASSSGGRVRLSSGATAEPFSSTPSERSLRTVT